MMGHTDKATINQRREMRTPMVDVLRSIHLKRGDWSPSDTADKNRARALMDRGYASPEAGTKRWYCTPAGKVELERIFGPYLEAC